MKTYRYYGVVVHKETYDRLAYARAMDDLTRAVRLATIVAMICTMTVIIAIARIVVG